MTDKPSHEEVEHLVVDVVYPAHVERTESEEFRMNKRTLVHKLDIGCFSCGSKDKREVHHFLTEWSLANDVDWDKVWKLSQHFDIYGYAHQLGDKPFTGPDDIRNLCVICAECHRGAGTGIHNVPFPLWISQAAAKAGVQILKPTKGE